MTRSRWWLLADVAAIVPLLGVLVLAGVLVAYEYRIQSNPMTASAFVVEKQVSQRGSESSYDLRYRFVATSGGEYSGWTQASREIFDRISIGDQLEIRYAGDAPEYREVITDTSGPLFNLFVTGGVAIVLLPLVYLAWIGVRRLRSDLRRS